MIIYTVNGLVIYETRADKPAQDWTGKAEYILDDHDPADAELIGKIKALAPFLLLTTQNGRIVDAVGDTEARKAWEATHPSTPNTWQQLLDAVNELRNTGLDPSMIEAKVAAAVSKFLEENPITGDSAVSSHNTSQTAHSDIRLMVSDLTARLNALADSDSKISVADIIDNLSTNVSDRPLSAKMGVELKRLIDSIELPTDVMRYTEQTLTDEQKAQARANIGAANDAEFKALSKKAIVGKSGPNLFDKNAVTAGYYIRPGNGELMAATNFNASDFIPVEAGKVYSVPYNGNSAFYDKDKKYLSNGGSNSPFTVPANACYFRVTVGVDTLDTFMLNEGNILLPYEEYGVTVLTMDSFDDALLNELKETLIDPDEETDEEIDEVIFDVEYFDKVKKHLMNPFIKTQIHLIGDSITAGQGGTGYSATGETIPGSANKANVLTATCWSNMLYHYVDEHYNKEFFVRPDHEAIKYNNCTPSFANGEIVRGDLRISVQRATIINNKVENNAVQFSFYGDMFAIQYAKGKWSGIFNVFVDGELRSTIDCYSDTETLDNVYELTGLTESEHVVSIGLTNTKNDSASAAHVSLTGIVVKKTAVVKPYGIGGGQSGNGAYIEARLIGADFVMMQYGTNDRHTNFTPDNTMYNLINAVKQIKENIGAETILMCACPANNQYEASEPYTRYYHMWDVKNAVARAAKHCGMPYIDNYDAFIRYAEQHDLTIDELLADGLHPNDLGYKVMFENIMRALDLPIMPY